MICVSSRNDPAVNSERACSQWAFAKPSNSVRESILEEIPRTFWKFQPSGKSHPPDKINVYHIQGIYVIDVCALCSMICYHDQTCIKKRCHEKSKNTALFIELCFHSLRWSTWNFKSTETIDGFSILEFYPSSLPPHLNPKSEWPMYNCGAGRSTPSPIWETSNNFCCQALPQRYPEVQRAPNGTY